MSIDGADTFARNATAPRAGIAAFRCHILLANSDVSCVFVIFGRFTMKMHTTSLRLPSIAVHNGAESDSAVRRGCAAVHKGVSSIDAQYSSYLPFICLFL